MNDLDRLIRARIDAFVQELGELVRRAALEAVSDALGGKTRAAPRAKRDKPAAPRKLAKRGKRSPSDLESLADRIQHYVADHPGLGAQHIARALDASTKDLVLPMKKLVSTGSLTTKGQRRATKYFRGKR